MKLSAALEYEKVREDSSNWNKIVLHKDGKFYHVYEWSAWLLKIFVCTEDLQKERGDKTILSVSRYKTKVEEYAMLGFPVESISKYVPEYESVREMEDGDLELSIKLPLNGDETFEVLQQEFEQWKQQLEFKENKQKSRRDITNSDGQAANFARSGMFQILAGILSYPVESKTPAENIDFISNLKRQVASLL